MNQAIDDSNEGAGEEKVDEGKLAAAIIARRDESRRINEEWADIDREAWEALEKLDG